MEIAINEADILVSGITTLANRQMMLQTEYTKNEKRVLSATDAALKAKTKADKANTELYQLNNGFKNVSGTLEVKSGTIGGAKNLALDLQERANRLSNQASNKLEYLTGDLLTTAHFSFHILTSKEGIDEKIPMKLALEANLSELKKI